MSCVSCKNQSSFDRCTNRPLKGLIFCGKHVKVKSPRIWKDVNNLDVKAVHIQKVWRGYSLRKWLVLAGPGVLKRSVCHNDEELVTLEDKQSVNPLDYFAFEENEKVYWFDIRSLSENCMTKVDPTNPYTREPISIETRRRLRALCVKRDRNKLENMHNARGSRTVDEIIHTTWINICQIIIENGFFEMSPLYFVSLNRPQLFIFISILRQDLIAWAAEHTNPKSRRYRYVFWMKRLIDEYSKGMDLPRVSYLTGRVLTAILNDVPNNYPICFIIMSALHRL